MYARPPPSRRAIPRRRVSRRAPHATPHACGAPTQNPLKRGEGSTAGGQHDGVRDADGTPIRCSTGMNLRDAHTAVPPAVSPHPSPRRRGSARLTPHASRITPPVIIV